MTGAGTCRGEVSTSTAAVAAAATALRPVARKLQAQPAAGSTSARKLLLLPFLLFAAVGDRGVAGGLWF